MGNKQDKVKAHWSSVVSLGLGIASIFLWEFSIIPILAIGFGILAAFRTKNNEWQMWVGIILGLVFLVVRISHGHMVGIFSNTYSSSNNTPQISAVPAPSISNPDSKFICPEDYQDSEQQKADLKKFLEDYIAANPQATINDFDNYRYSILVKNNCQKTLDYMKSHSTRSL